MPPKGIENKQQLTCIKLVESELEEVGIEMYILIVVFVAWTYYHP